MLPSCTRLGSNLSSSSDGFEPHTISHLQSGQVSADLLVEDSHFEAAVECKLALSGCLARQWLGALLMSPDPSESWVLEGMAAGLEDVFTTQLLGGNEVAWRWVGFMVTYALGFGTCVRVNKGSLRSFI